MNHCQCPPGCRSSECPEHRQPLTREESEFLLLVEESYKAARQPVPTMRHSLRLFALAKQVIKETIG